MIRAFLVLLIFGLTAFTGASSFAQKGYVKDKQTPGHTVYLIFHKLTGLRPNLAAALVSSEKYKNADAAEREILTLNFHNKFSNEFEALNVKESLITVITPVNMETDLNGLRMKVSLVNRVDKNADIYFPYNWGGMSFAVIPDKIASFMEVPMPADQLKKIRRLSDGYMQKMIVRLLPVSADKTSPIALDGVKQWLILSQIVSVEYVNSQGQTIWSWADNKYARSTSSELFELKK